MNPPCPVQRRVFSFPAVAHAACMQHQPQASRDRDKLAPTMTLIRGLWNLMSVAQPWAASALALQPAGGDPRAGHPAGLPIRNARLGWQAKNGLALNISNALG
jgi:hypothetical protein